MAVRRGEIYLVDLNPVQGREQAGRRPVLVLSADAIIQLRSLDPRRFQQAPAGRVSDATLDQVETAVRRCLGL